MRGRRMREAPSRGFDFCLHMRDICQDFVQRLPELSHIDMEAVAAKLKTPVIFDGKNLFDPQAVRKAGIEYYSVGR